MIGRMLSIIAMTLLIGISCSVNAGLVGDTVTTKYGGSIFIPDLPPDSSLAVVGSGLEFYSILARTGTQISSNFGDSSLRLDLGYHAVWSSGLKSMFVIDYSFASSKIEEVKLLSFDYSGAYFCCGSGLDAIVLTGPNSFELQFSSLWAPATLEFSVTSVDEPKTILLCLLSLGILGLAKVQRFLLGIISRSNLSSLDGRTII